MTPTTLTFAIGALLVLSFALEMLLSLLNARRWADTLPAAQSEFYNAEQYQNAREYNLAKSQLSGWQSLFGLVLSLGMVISGGFGWLSDQLAATMVDPIWVSLAFLGILLLANSLLNLPFSLYSTFTLEATYGFNRTTPRTFVLDKLKAYFLTAVFGGAIGYALIALVLSIGPSFWIYAWIIITALVLFIQMFYTSLLLPMFNKLTPLSEGPLRTEIERFASRVHFPLTNVYVMDGSKRSSKGNAFFSGIGPKKKIVLFDTLVEKHTIPELVSVLAHEVGHFKKKHIVRSTLISLVHIGFMLWLLSLSLFSPVLSNSLGAEAWSIGVNLIAFSILYTPISLLTGIAMNGLSRKHEFEADAFAALATENTSMIAALKRLSTENLSNLDPHPAFVFFHYDHPPVLERIAALNGPALAAEG